MTEITSDPRDTLVPRGRLAYGAIFAGVIFALSLLMLLEVLGAALGISAMAPAGAAFHLGAGTVIWSLLIPLVSLIVGGYTASALAGSERSEMGAFHGAMVWGLSMLFLFAFSSAFAVRGGSAFTLAFFSAVLALFGGMFGGYLGSRPSTREALEGHGLGQRHVTT